MTGFYYQLDAQKSLSKQPFRWQVDTLTSDQIYAETAYSVISTGTEVAAWQGLKPLRPIKLYPRVMGYCNMAKVIAKGKNVISVNEGDYILTHQSHRTDFICSEHEVLLSFTHTQQELLKSLTTTYLYHLGYAALLAGDFKPGYQVAVIGMGSLGVTTASLVKALGGEPIVFSNQSLGNVEFKQFFRKSDFKLEILESVTGMPGVDLVINTSNRWEDHELALKVARKLGCIVCLGFPGRGEPAPDFNPFEPEYFYDKQLTIKHCGYVAEDDLKPEDVRFTLKRNIKYLASLIESKQLDTSLIISDVCPADELESAYLRLSAREQGLRTILLDWKL